MRSLHIIVLLLLPGITMHSICSTAIRQVIMHDQPSFPLRLHTANSLRVLRFVDAIKHEVVLLIQGVLLSLLLQADAVQVHVLNWSQLIAVLGSGHLALVEVHCGEALAIATVNSTSAQLILVTVLITCRLASYLRIVAVYGPQDSRSSQPCSIIDLVIVST